jgi:hypothetical protein
MSFSRLLRKLSQPSLAHSAPTSAGSSPRASADDPHESPTGKRRQASEPMPAIPRPWRRKRPSTADRSSLSQSTSSLPPLPKAESPTSDGGMRDTPAPMPLPTSTPGGFLTNLATLPPPELIPAVGPVQDKLTEAWSLVKDDPKIADKTPGLNAAGASSVPMFLFRSNLIPVCLI